MGFLKELDEGLSISGSTSTSYKDKTTGTAIEYGESQELTLTKNDFSTTIFKNDIGELNTDGIEFSYGKKDFKVFASLSKFSDVFGPVWTCSDFSGRIRIRPDAYRCARMRLADFGTFRKF